MNTFKTLFVLLLAIVSAQADGDNSVIDRRLRKRRQCRNCFKACDDGDESCINSCVDELGCRLKSEECENCVKDCVANTVPKPVGKKKKKRAKKACKGGCIESGDCQPKQTKNPAS
uniref:4Fe-4S ferredoxin-type domain-containing protein n=1 Tax=Pseudo-nitzschia australis TaxID=44445 RepID=A0A7S4AVN7_9STRA|mmetsp:Transcript_22181/g.48254  ORF Transcript_22181/g.48254 Transcript_22181/m.48254 type:complete len:116 (+) Transcript_22181:162-509(+)